MKKLRIVVATNEKGEYIDWQDLDLPITFTLRKSIIENVAVQGKGTFLKHGSIEGATNVLLAKEKPSELKGIDLVTPTAENIPELLEVFPDKYVYVLGGANVVRELWDKADLIQHITLYTEMAGAPTIPPMEGFTLACVEEGRGFRYEMWKRKKENGLLPKYLKR